MSGHRAASWTVAGGHLAAAALTLYAGVPVATPVVLVLGGVAFALGAARPERADSRARAPLGRETDRPAGGAAVGLDGRPRHRPARGGGRVGAFRP